MGGMGYPSDAANTKERFPKAFILRSCWQAAYELIKYLLAKHWRFMLPEWSGKRNRTSRDVGMSGCLVAGMRWNRSRLLHLGGSGAVLRGPGGKDGLNSFPCALLRHFDVLLLDFRQPQQNGGRDHHRPQDFSQAFTQALTTHFHPPHATQKVANTKKIKCSKGKTSVYILYGKRH